MASLTGAQMLLFYFLIFGFYKLRAFLLIYLERYKILMKDYILLDPKGIELNEIYLNIDYNFKNKISL